MTRGFTLIELLVTMAVLLIVVSGVAYGFSGANKLQTRDAAAERLRQAMLQARSNAQAGKKDCQVCGAASGICGDGDVPLDGWEVDVTAGSFSVYGVCGARTFSNHTESLPQGVTASLTGDNSTNLVFKPLGGTNLTTTRTVAVSVSGVTDKHFDVYTIGQITTFY